MDFDLTREQKMIRDEVRHFAKKEIAPRAEELEQSGEYPYDIYAKMAELGLMGIPIPEAYGGMGSDWVSLHLAIEEVSRLLESRPIPSTDDCWPRDSSHRIGSGCTYGPALARSSQRLRKPLIWIRSSSALWLVPMPQPA